VTESADSRAPGAVPEVATAGALLREAREAAGITVDTVAQQLKLAPRQVRALEEGDFAHLPGRTFIRGFMRNYARLLRLDPTVVLAALPDAGTGQPPDNPSLAPTPRPMGELPPDSPTRRSWTRWAIPLAMVAAVAVTAVYERMRPPEDTVKRVVPDKAAQLPVPAPAPVPASIPADTTALPNPLAPPADRTPTREGAAPDRTDAGGPPSLAMPPVAMDAQDGTVALSFLGTSWVEVRDATGAIVLSATGYAGGNQMATGRLPLEVVLGNANAVSVTFQGHPFDIAPFTKQNVAKFTLK
jgi:cytoskeleton protein RodZ